MPTTLTAAPADKISVGVDQRNLSRGHSAYYISINRRKHYFPTPEERDQEVTNLRVMQQLGTPIGDTTARDRLDIIDMRKMAAGYPGDVMQIFRLGLGHMPRFDKTLKEAADEFFAVKDAAVKALSLKPNSAKQQKQAVKTLCKNPEFVRMTDLQNPSFELWLRRRPLSAKGLHSYCKALGVFLNWAVGKKYLAESPLGSVDIPEPPPKRTVFTLKQVRTLFRVLETEFPDLVPLHAVMWFAGVRPETAEKLKYEDFHRKEKLIRLSTGKFDQGEAEHVENFPDTLWHWLPKKTSGPIISANHKHRITQLHNRLGYGKQNPWPSDVSRHSFASYFAAQCGSIEKVAFTINHKSSATTLKWYRKRVPKQDGVSYFRILPKNRLNKSDLQCE